MIEKETERPTTELPRECLGSRWLANQNEEITRLNRNAHRSKRKTRKQPQVNTTQGEGGGMTLAEHDTKGGGALARHNSR